jgi:hypothetical protein
MLACNGCYGLAFEMVQKKNEGTKIGGSWLKQQVNAMHKNTMQHIIVPSSKLELCMRFPKEWLKKRDKDNHIVNVTKLFCVVSHEHTEDEYNECREWRGGKNVSW